MLDRLKQVEEKFKNINEQLCDPAIVSDMDHYRKLMREIKRLTPVVEKYREYKTALAVADEAKSLLDGGGLDKDFRDMVIEEYESSKETLERIRGELKVLLLPPDPNDDKNVILEIRGGAGGEDVLAMGEELFVFNCSGCHQTDGQGIAGFAPALDGHEVVNDPDPDDAIEQVLEGGGGMPPFESLLEDGEIAAVLSYVRSAWSNDAPAVEPEEVAMHRED